MERYAFLSKLFISGTVHWDLEVLKEIFLKLECKVLEDALMVSQLGESTRWPCFKILQRWR